MSETLLQGKERFQCSVAVPERRKGGEEEIDKRQEVAECRK
jgi:hypothetical protein